MAEKTQDKTQGGQDGKPAAAGAEAKGNAAGGGIKPWLPLIVTVVLMPVLAIATTKMILVPSLKKVEAKTPAAGASEGEKSSAEGDKSGTPGKTKTSVALSKMLVNVAGTMGTRYLMTSVTLVGTHPDFKAKIEDNKDQLLDLANGTLTSKTIADLEKPGARNLIRSELMTVFNNALGGPIIQEIYITELAIQ